MHALHRHDRDEPGAGRQRHTPRQRTNHPCPSELLGRLYMEAEVVMLRRGDIAMERLTGKRAMVIDFTGPEEVTCRFSDGRLEDRFIFELDLARPTVWDSVFSLLKNPFGYEAVKKRPPAATATPRPRLARQTAGTTP